MKREYVKPVMESEEFVANEYVAACWKLTCTRSIFCEYNNYENVVGGTYDTLTAYVKDHPTNHRQIHQGRDCGLTFEDSNAFYHMTDVEYVHHELRWTQKGNGTTANAS